MSLKWRGMRVLALLLPALPPSRADGQSDGSVPAAVAGGALGLFSGTILGVAGSVIPCTQTYDGASCIAGHALGGAALGLLGGALSGAADVDRVKGAATSAAVGFLVGGAAGLVLKPLAQRFGWHDVLTIGLLGGAIGASPQGAALGFGGGAVAGVILWRLVPGGTFPDALAVVLAGTALGGIGGWLVRGMERDERDDFTRIAIPVARIRF